ncbi:hypothetical protein MG293_015149, partial [Ovis ammon polii]
DKAKSHFSINCSDTEKLSGFSTQDLTGPAGKSGLALFSEPVDSKSKKPSWRCMKRHPHMETSFCTTDLLHRLLRHTYCVQMLGKRRHRTDLMKVYPEDMFTLPVEGPHNIGDGLRQQMSGTWNPRCGRRKSKAALPSPGSQSFFGVSASEAKKQPPPPLHHCNPRSCPEDEEGTLRRESMALQCERANPGPGSHKRVGLGVPSAAILPPLPWGGAQKQRLSAELHSTPRCAQPQPDNQTEQINCEPTDTTAGAVDSAPNTQEHPELGLPPGKMQALVMLLAAGGTCYLGLLAAAAAAANPGQPNALGSLPAHRRQKRDWIWNQMHIDEERNDSLPHYVGKIKSSVDRKNTEYQLRGESAGKVFRVDKNTGDVYALERLDREKISEYHLTALVVDKDTKRNLESPSSFTIKVHDVNDNWPVFTHRVFNASVPEMSGIGTSVIQVTAVDADDPTVADHASVVYQLTKGKDSFDIRGPGPCD